MSERITIDRGYFAEQLDVATKVERERIIKLLEDYQQQALVSNIVYLGLERAIKIIKGEIK